MHCISEKDVLAASERIHGRVHITPVMTSTSLNEAAGKQHDSIAFEIVFKCENFQKTGSFKARGAANAVLLSQTASGAVCTHSSGNHATALAWAAGLRKLSPHIVMPKGAPASKVAAVKAFGGHVIECEATQAAREAMAAKVQVETGAEFIHPSEDPRVIAGQGTVGLELLQQTRDARSGPGSDSRILDVIVVPVGGGGLISGVATAVKAADPRILVIGAEPAAADDAYRSKQAGSIQTNASPPITVADGLKTNLGPNTWPIVRDKVDSIVTVEEAEIRSALRLLYSRLKVVLEPSAATGLAAVLSHKFGPVLRDLKVEGRPVRVGIVLCGGNLDLDKLPEYIAP